MQQIVSLPFGPIEFDQIIFSPYCYQQRIVSAIDSSGRQIVLDTVGQLFEYSECTIKIELLERYSKQMQLYCARLAQQHNHTGPVTCHAFKASTHSTSFGMHADKEDVFLHVVDGIKKMQVAEVMHTLHAGDTLFIPANTPHKAFNDHHSLMLSFGLEMFLSDRLI